MIEFKELFSSFKELTEKEKKKAIIDFLKNNIESLLKINQLAGVSSNLDINKIIAENENVDHELDLIYELIHLLTEQTEMFIEKTTEDYYE